MASAVLKNQNDHTYVKPAFVSGLIIMYMDIKVPLPYASITLTRIGTYAVSINNSQGILDDILNTNSMHNIVR